ncbi:hypothetical protein [Micromonospora sp. NBC_01412]|uniref:hypothetical protein n=1 Tax=Micromonospora sp. NBC_01412 TaxID=2903590 RepID=UPI00324BE368
MPGLPLGQQRVPELNGGGARQKLVVDVPAGDQRPVRGQPRQVVDPDLRSTTDATW